MDILQVLPDSYGETGGISVHVRNISERLARNHNVTVYATNYGSRFPRHELINGVTVERFKCYAPSSAYMLSWEMLLRLRRVHSEIVHGHGYHAFPLHFSTLAKTKKFVVTPHFHGAGHSAFRSCLLRMLKPFGERTLVKANQIIAVSDYEKSLICRKFGFDPRRITVLPNGVNFSEFAALKKQESRFKSILYVGYLVGFKGVQHLVEVLPKLPNDVTLDVVGNGPLKPFLERRAEELKVRDRICITHNLPRKELLQKYANADVFVMLSRYEAYSLVVAEALTAGVPCIVADSSALSEWIDNKSCFGIQVPVNLDELARLIVRVLDMETNESLTRKWIGTKIPDWNDVAKRLERLYDY
jgi:glycosyltransferase involved in cell wall biosynthesis